MHSAIVKRRTLRIVPFARHVPGRHVTHAHDRQLANFTFADECMDFFVIPRVAIEQIHRNDAIGGLDFLHEFPFGFRVGGDRFLGEDVQIAGERATDQRRANIRQRE